jgi:hypothetical protein
MATVDLLRAALFAVMAIPGMPTAPMVGLLVVAVFIGPVFGAAGVSYLAAHLGREVFRSGTGLRMLSSQGFQVLGFAVGGVAVAAWGPRTVLALDALTFVCSALLIGVLAPPDAPRAPAPDGGAPRGVRSVLWADRRTRTLIALSALAGFFVAPEGVAVPFAAQLHHSSTAAGFLLAAIPLGSVAGIYLLVRRVPADQRTSAMSMMVVGCGLPLVLSGAVGSLPLSFACWLVSGLCAAYQVEVLTQLVQSIPDELRSRALGVCNAVLLGAQGIGVAVFGAVSQEWTPQGAVALAGGVGAACALWLVTGPLRRSAPASVASSA